MFTKSIRWRLQLWLGFLLLCVLSGFGVTIYQLQRITQLNQLDEELERRVAALNIAVRGGPGPESARRPPRDRGPGSHEFDDASRPPPPRGRPGGPPPDEGPGPRGGRRDVRLTGETASLFVDARPDAFYFTVWSRDGSVLRCATNAPAALPLPERLGRDTSIHTRTRGVFRESFQCLGAAFAQQKQFTADASHELRTPIAVLISEAQTTLARERSAAEYRETIEANLAAAQQMRQLTESLLTLARLDAGHEALTRARFDLAQLAIDGIERVRPLAAERRIQIHCDLPATECCGDVERLRQVITNLVTNAIHYNRDGGEVRVATRTENGAAVLAVTDTGIGIATEDLPHIFERFYRADKSRSRGEGRSGLGLAISKAIVDAHDGRIEVMSTPGAGTTFTLRLSTGRNLDRCG